MADLLAWPRTADVADKAYLLIAILVPPILVFCLRRIGVLLGAITVWGSLILAGELLRVLDPARRDGLTTFFDLLWFALGWVAGLLYCLPFYGLKQLYLWLRRDRPQAGSARQEAGHECGSSE